MNPVLTMCRQNPNGIDFSGIIDLLRSQTGHHIQTPSKRPPRKSTISPIMYSFACVNLAPKYHLAFRVKWLGERESLDQLCEVVREDIKELAKTGHWQLKPGQLDKLIYLAAMELYAPRLKIPYRTKIEYLNISKDTFYRKHRHYLNQLFAHLDDYTNVAYSHIKKHTRG